MNKVLRNLALPAAALALAMFAVYHLLYAQEQRPPLLPPVDPPHASMAHSVAGVGMVEPQSEDIDVGTAQEGIVLEVYYPADKVGRRVRQGEPLFRVDDRTLQAQLAAQRASLRVAEAELARLEQQPRAEDVPPLEAKVKAAAARKADQELRYQRVEQLTGNAIAREEVVQRRYAVDIAAQELEQAQRELDRLKAGAWQPEIEVAKSNVAVAQANTAATEVEIDRCLVRAPIEGEILQVNVRVGEYVSGSAGKALLVLGDTERLRVRVDVDEEDIARFQNGQAARAVPRGASQREIPLRLVRIEPYVVPKRMLSGQGSERVDTRVLQAIYEISASDPHVYVGQQLDVFIDVAE